MNASCCKRVVKNAFAVLASKFRVLLDTMEQRPRIVRDIGGADRAPTPENDVVDLQNEQAMFVPNGNYRNPLREAKHQREQL